MKSTWPIIQAFVELSVLISLSAILNSESVGGVDWSPNIQLFEIRPSVGKNGTEGEEVRRLDLVKNSEVIVGEDVSPKSRLVIKCNATFPVQFIYIGAGRPEFTTFTNVQWRADLESPLTFEAEVSLGLLGFQGTLREEDTGNYTCRSIQNSTILSYFYIYVPGPSIFTPPDGYNSELYFTSKDKNLWIPCTAANPKAIVSLHKTANGRLECPSGGQGVSTYDSKKGFLVNLKEVKNPDGVYVCVASYDESFRMMEYRLIPTNASLPDGKNHPCRPSPCGKSAECSVVDGFPVCYCFRGLSGNPYSECIITKDRCSSNQDCTKGLFCVQGKCTKDPCNPSPCGGGSTCISNGGRPRCSCQTGFDGKPPYCRKKCKQSGDCPETDECVKNYCDSVCPGPCGMGAECLVVQTNYNRTAVCSCGPGFFGDPLERCYAIGDNINTTPPPWASCPAGYVGPGPPNCKKAECQTDGDCPFENVCNGRLCVDSGGQCPNTCGIKATCPLSQLTGKRNCACPPGTTGDPLVRCFDTTTIPVSPCSPNPCPGNAVCEIGLTGVPICICPAGFRGQPPNCISDTQTCQDDSDCPQGEDCVDRVCLEPCDGACGENSKCELSRSSGKYSCVCRDNYSGDPYTACRPGRSPCVPSPCANFAECRVINGQAACRCILGYDGDAFSQCSPASRSRNDEPFKPVFGDEAEFFYSSRNSPRDGVTRTQRPSEISSSREDQCDPRRVRSCGRNYECSRNLNGVARCICVSDECQPSRTSGPLKPANGRLCRSWKDCLVPDLCINSTCINPCGPDHSPCANVENSECRVIENRPLCTCIRGYVGSPANGIGCQPDTAQSPVVSCDSRRGTGPTGCDTKSECRVVHGRSRCVCGDEYVGQYPDCRLKCGTDRDCHSAHACLDYQCVNPCEKRNICGYKAFCSVIDHNPRCECQPGFRGNPWVGCSSDGSERGRIRPRGLDTKTNCVGTRCTLF